jgi:hypothetical protein
LELGERGYNILTLSELDQRFAPWLVVGITTRP